LKGLVGFAHGAAALGAGRLQGGEVAGHGVGFVALGAFDDVLRHTRDRGHELFAREPPLLHQGELVLPLAGEFGRGERVDA